MTGGRPVVWLAGPPDDHQVHAFGVLRKLGFTVDGPNLGLAAGLVHHRDPAIGLQAWAGNNRDLIARADLVVRTRSEHVPSDAQTAVAVTLNVPVVRWHYHRQAVHDLKVWLESR